jgi:Calx-beta domain
MPLRRSSFLVALSLVAGLLSLSSPAAACAGGHVQIALSDLPAEATGPDVWFFYAVEGQAGFHFEARFIGDNCNNDRVDADYAVSPGSASTADVTPTAGRTLPLCDQENHPAFNSCGQARQDISVGLPNDSDAEPAVETATIALSNPSGGGLGNPHAAPLHIVGDEGSPRAGFGGTGYSHRESFATVSVPIFRAGTSGAVAVTVSVDPSSTATPNEDFTGLPTSVTIPDGQRVATASFAVTNDSLPEETEQIALRLSGAVDPTRATETVSIVDNEEGGQPSSRLHHPRHKWRYKKSDYRIREVHIFTTDTGSSGVVAAHFALRRNMKNGDCVWLTANGWQRKDCSSREWLGTAYDDVGELWRIRLKQLKSSVGTRIKNYTAFSRAVDGATNVESDFAEKRNANTFEVKRTRKRGR